MKQDREVEEEPWSPDDYDFDPVRLDLKRKGMTATKLCVGHSGTSLPLTASRFQQASGGAPTRKRAGATRRRSSPLARWGMGWIELLLATGFRSRGFAASPPPRRAGGWLPGRPRPRDQILVAVPRVHGEQHNQRKHAHRLIGFAGSAARC